ncbi:MAG: hypothetical protein LAQ69_50665, partial [Acidobacteriia bacterium]|nr:hypothetical protein [Terriglobia bacterium]
MLDQQLQADGKPVVAQKRVQDSDLAEGDLPDNASVVLAAGGGGLAIKGDEPGMNQLVSLGGLGEERDRREGCNKHDQENADDHAYTSTMCSNKFAGNW